MERGAGSVALSALCWAWSGDGYPATHGPEFDLWLQDILLEGLQAKTPET